MGNRNYYRGELYDEFLGISKVITAPTRYEYDRKVENQKRIWAERRVRELKKQNKEEMKIQAEKLTLIDKSRIEEYMNIIKVIKAQKHTFYYKSLKNEEKYQDFSTTLKEPKPEDAYVDVGVPKESFLEKFSKAKKEKRISKEQEAMNIFQTRKNYYLKKLDEEKQQYEIDKKNYEKKREYDNKTIDERVLKFESGDIYEIEEYFTDVLNKSKYPSDFTIDFELQYLVKAKTMIVSYYLPNEESIPRIIQHKYIASKNEITEVELKSKEFEKLYNDVIYMCALKTIKEILLQ